MGEYKGGSFEFQILTEKFEGVNSRGAREKGD